MTVTLQEAQTRLPELIEQLRPANLARAPVTACVLGLVPAVVLSHLVPADDPLVTEQMWTDAARSQFKGEIVVARDLMEI